VEYLASDRTIDVRYHVVQEHSGNVVEAVRETMRDHAVGRVVLDLRNNGGGEAGGFRELLRFLVDQRVPLVVLIGRLTFSAGSTLALHLERRVPTAVFIGETMGGAPAFWADPDTVTLPYSGLVALVDSRFIPSPLAGDTRLEVQPDIAVPFTSADYFAGRDPVLERALS
jgi:C-terminal processing protease CtpA/Prc